MNYCTFHPPGGDQDTSTYGSPTDLSVAWHTYGLSWEPGSITCYVDGVATFTSTGSDVPDQPTYSLALLPVIDGNKAKASTPTTASFNIQSVNMYKN
ncbi:MAG: family 16 glycosylhydrolase [Acidimicrobiales bacterium]